MIRRESLSLLLFLSLAAPALAASPPPLPPPPTPADLVNQARAAQARGENDLAVVLAQSAIVADPAKPSSYDALGDIYAAESQPEFARNFYDKALEIDPADADATKAITALDHAGDTRKADASDSGAKP
jgi:tetratricopeptide (TPR) repeat protein